MRACQRETDVSNYRKDAENERTSDQGRGTVQSAEGLSIDALEVHLIVLHIVVGCGVGRADVAIDPAIEATVYAVGPLNGSASNRVNVVWVSELAAAVAGGTDGPVSLAECVHATLVVRQPVSSVAAADGVSLAREAVRDLDLESLLGTIVRRVPDIQEELGVLRDVIVSDSRQ